jgi:cholesterol oxidase
MTPGNLGLSFSEVMSGDFALGATDPAAGAQQGVRQKTNLTMHATISIADLDQFIQNPQHPGNLSGTIDFTPFGANIPCDRGVFNLFRSGDVPLEKLMVYELGFLSGTQRYYLAGKKFVKHDHGPEVLQETTTLFTVLHQGADASGAIVGAGILRLGAKQLADLVKTMNVTGAENTFQSVQAVAKFLKFFVGELWHTYI